jgi:uncharacterized protein involved in exopolysaccharide biosynthesis
MDSNEITKYLDMARRRKYWIIIPFMVVILGGLAFLLVAPKVYEAETLILVQSQTVPQDYVRSIVSEGVDERLRTITQQVTSRTNLEAIIRQYRLADEIGPSLTLDAVVEAVRKKIKIDVSRGGGGRDTTSAFTISYRGKDPKKVMEVTNTLASNFISQNLQIRESQAQGLPGALHGRASGSTERQPCRAPKASAAGGPAEQKSGGRGKSKTSHSANIG